MDFTLLYDYFPELYRPDLKKTHSKQWDRFLGAFVDLCIWIHCSRAKHKHGRGIVLFPGWWIKHNLVQHGRWHFDLHQELEPYLFTDGHYNYKRGLSREWYVTDDFKHRSASLVRDIRFRSEPRWKKVIEEVIIPISEKPQICRSFLQLPKLCNSVPQLDNIENDLILATYAKYLCNGLELKYTEANTGRLHHPLQNIKKENRSKLFEGWFSYDIIACAPSILKQLYCRLEPLEALPSIDNFISKRADIRKTIAKQTGIEEITIKRALTGMFFGLTVPSEKQVNWDIKTSSFDTYKFSIINTFGPEITSKLLANELFYSIVSECQIKIMRRISEDLRENWCSITDIGFELTNVAGGIKQFSRWSSRQAVAHTYFGYERIVIDIISSFLSSEDIQFLLIHDGWVCNKQIDTKKLKQLILDETDFDLDFDCEKLIQT